ncbi:MAG: LysR family transcriptional regulator [Steroidobacteraceae bacterium]|nr:LysR family transcriptional regulator [Steroidobacteraceae bacterium]
MDAAYDRLPLNALRVFEAVATRLNFADAAEALHVTPAAVSQQVKSLEDYLQTPLFRRRGRSVELTSEGADLLPRVRRGLDELEAALQQSRRQRDAGTLNVSMLSSFLQKWLTPRLGAQGEHLHGIELRVHTSREPVDFARSDFHAVIRLGTGHYPGLYSEKLLDDWLVPVAIPALIGKYGMIPCSKDLGAFPLLYSSDEPWSAFVSDATAGSAKTRPALLDDSASVISAALEGLGFAVARWSLVERDVASGRLAVASEVARQFRYSYYFICPLSYAQMPKVLRFRDWLRAEAARHPLPPSLRKT